MLILLVVLESKGGSACFGSIDEHFVVRGVLGSSGDVCGFSLMFWGPPAAVLLVVAVVLFSS